MILKSVTCRILRNQTFTHVTQTWLLGIDCIFLEENLLWSVFMIQYGLKMVNNSFYPCLYAKGMETRYFHCIKHNSPFRRYVQYYKTIFYSKFNFSEKNIKILSHEALLLIKAFSYNFISNICSIYFSMIDNYKTKKSVKTIKVGIVWITLSNHIWSRILLPLNDGLYVSFLFSGGFHTLIYSRCIIFTETSDAKIFR